MVVLNKQGYIIKVENLLGQWDTYRPLSRDPTKKQKNKLMSLLGDSTYKSTSPKEIPSSCMGYLISTERTSL